MEVEAGVARKFYITASIFQRSGIVVSQPLRDTIHGQRFMKDGRSYGGGQKVAFLRGRWRTDTGT